MGCCNPPGSWDAWAGDEAAPRGARSWVRTRAASCPGGGAEGPQWAGPHTPPQQVPAWARGCDVHAGRRPPPSPGHGSPKSGHHLGQGPLGSPPGHTGVRGEPAAGGGVCLHSPTAGQVQPHLHGQVEPDGLPQAVPPVPAPRTVVVPAG
ncbi:Hypothetical predicted protein [Lynx pardinus]|uniref:Uncharacterized protein n=1 Tax=Lynx pardinus TaxID=191816 RepID=A0A485NS71_LYNPA|nr:Hypothetical predicted protein [Lynx pardinus]